MTYVAENEEEDVDEGVRGANAALHPHWRGREVSIVMRVCCCCRGLCCGVADHGVVSRGSFGGGGHTWEWGEEDG